MFYADFKTIKSVNSVWNSIWKFPISIPHFKKWFYFKITSSKSSNVLIIFRIWRCYGIYICELSENLYYESLPCAIQQFQSMAHIVHCIFESVHMQRRDNVFNELFFGIVDEYFSQIVTAPLPLKGCWIMTNARVLSLSREGSLSCHTCKARDLGFNGLGQKKTPHTRLVESYKPGVLGISMLPSWVLTRWIHVT